MSEETVDVRTEALEEWHPDTAQVMALVHLADQVGRVATALETMAKQPHRSPTPRKPKV